MKKIIIDESIIKYKSEIKKIKRKEVTLKNILITILVFLYIILYDNVTINEKIKKTKLCLCVAGKKENLYAKEYVNHYKKLGYNHIYIYDNNDINDEKFEDVLQDEINSNFVSVINYRGKKRIQCDAYKDCYEKYSQQYDWLSFFDFDEFLEVDAKNIQEFINNKRYEKCINIKINFLFYSDNELLYYDNRSLEERFTTPLYNHRSNNVIKITVRGGLKINYWSIGCCVHSSQMKCNSCNSAGDLIDYKTIINNPPNYQYAKLKHYYTKSTEEYLIKSSKGSASNDVHWDEKRKKYKYKLYFYYNKRTKEKENPLKKLFNLTSPIN